MKVVGKARGVYERDILTEGLNRSNQIIETEEIYEMEDDSDYYYVGKGKRGLKIKKSRFNMGAKIPTGPKQGKWQVWEVY